MSGEELIVQPYDWKGNDRDDEYSLRIWTHNQNSERVLLRVEDYKPFCRIELPTLVGGRKATWTVEAIKAYAGWLRACLSNDDDEPLNITFAELGKLYYYKPGQLYPFLICEFANEKAMRHCVALVNKRAYQIRDLGEIRARVWETSVTSIHQMITRCNLLHNNSAEVGYGSWLKLLGERVPEEDQISTCQYEYLVSWKTITAVPQAETLTWKIHPKVASFDIEAYSANERSMPNKMYAQDVPFQISFVTQQLGRKETRKKYLLSLGICGPVPDTEVIHCANEVELIDGMCDLINKEDPSIITGYNIFRFDFPYLDARIKLYLRNWKHCSLLKDHETYVSHEQWKSGAYGFMSISSLEAEGRIVMDMYPIIKRDHKLDRYTLDFVANHFLGVGKDPVTARQMFEIYRKGMEATKSKDPDRIRESEEKLAVVGNYCVRDAWLCIDLMEKLNTWTALTETSTIVQVTMVTVFTKGQQIRVYNQIYSYAFREGIVIDQREETRASFSGGAVVKPIPGRYILVILLDFASLYPSIIRRYNICFTTLIPPGSDIPDEHCMLFEWTETNADGTSITYSYRFIKREFYYGILPRMCENLVNARNAVRKQISPKNDDVTNAVLEQRQLAIKVSANSIFGFLGAYMLALMEGARCITAMGRILIGQAGKRAEEKHGTKVVYGDTDSIMICSGTEDPYECVDKIPIIQDDINSLFVKPLVMECDGVFAVFFVLTPKRYAAVPLFRHKMSKDDTCVPVEFEPGFEITGHQLYFLTIFGDMKVEQKYVAIPIICNARLEFEQRVIGLPVAKGGRPDPKALIKKGIVLNRRDNCLWTREVYLQVLLNVMFGRSLERALGIVDSEVIRMMTRGVAFDKMVVTREIGSNYKPNSSYPLKIFADELKKQGQIIQGGERIDYVFVRCEQPERNEKQGYKMRLPEMFWMNSEREPIDRLHYVEKGIQNSVQQLIYLGYKTEIDEIMERCKPEKRKQRKIYTYVNNKYIQIWVKMIKQKEKVVHEIKLNLPHFASQDPYYSVMANIEEVAPLPVENNVFVIAF